MAVCAECGHEQKETYAVSPATGRAAIDGRRWCTACYERSAARGARAWSPRAMRPAAGGLVQGFLLAAAAALVIIGVAGKCGAEAPLPRAALCRVAAGPGIDGAGMTSQGSGTLIDGNRRRQGLVLTNAHVVADGGPYLVRFADGDAFRARLALRDDELDLAALVIEQVDRRPAPWTDRLEGRRYRTAGFGRDGRLMYMEGEYLGVLATGRRQCFRFSAPSRQGDSGGGVFNGRGELCGVRWGTSFAAEVSGDTIAVRPEQVAEFLGRLGVSRPARGGPPAASGSAIANRRAVTATQYCADGTCGSAGVWIGVSRRPAEPAGRIYEPDAAPAGVGGGGGCDCGARLAALEKAMAGLRAESAAWAKREDLAGYVRREEYRPPDVSGLVDHDELAAAVEAKNQQLAELQQATVEAVEKQQSLWERVKQIAAAVEASAQPQAASTTLGGLSAGVKLAALLGLSGGPAAVVGIAGAIAYRRLKKRIARRASAGVGGRSEGSFRG